MYKVTLSNILYEIDAFKELINFLQMVKEIAVEERRTDLLIIYRHIMRNVARIAAKTIEIDKYISNKKNNSTQINKNSR